MRSETQPTCPRRTLHQTIAGGLLWTVSGYRRDPLMLVGSPLDAEACAKDMAARRELGVRLTALPMDDESDAVPH